MRGINESDRLLYEVAVAHCITEGKKQAEIIKLLGLNQTAVSRLSTNNPHITKPALEPVLPDGIDRDDFLRQVDSLLHQRDVTTYLRELSLYDRFSVDVIHGPPVAQKTGPDGFDPRFAPYISRLVDRARVVGVAWELGIKPYADNIPNFVSRNGNNGEEAIRFVPLCGITADSDEALVKSSTAIAMRFHRLVNKNFSVHEPKLLNLNCIPLVHPKRRIAKSASTKSEPWAPDSIDVIEYLREAFPDYEEIFGSMTPAVEVKAQEKDALINKVDMMLTGLGASAKETDNLLRKLYPRTEKIRISDKPVRYLTRKQIRDEVIVGDIAGVLLANTQCANAAFNESVVNYLNNKLATLRPEHLVACCQRADNAMGQVLPGVVLLADGAVSVDCLIAAVKHGYVNHVVIDDELAQGIESRIK